MPCASRASLFPGESVRVGRIEVSRNGCPRGMVIGFACRSAQNPAYRPAGQYLQARHFASLRGCKASNSGHFDSGKLANVNDPLRFSIHVRLTGAGESKFDWWRASRWGFERACTDILPICQKTAAPL